MFTLENLNHSLDALGIPPSPALFGSLRQAYTAEDRHYHTDRHIAACLTHLQDVRDEAAYPAEIEVAIWFHDAIYDTRRTDNEERSATWARTFLAAHETDSSCVERITALILATKNHTASGSDAAIMVDIDLAILGASAPVFEAYDAAIRREYEWVPETRYREGRMRVLTGFLARASIYRTPWFGKRYEQRARQNLERKIEELRLS